MHVLHRLLAGADVCRAWTGVVFWDRGAGRWPAVSRAAGPQRRRAGGV